MHMHVIFDVVELGVRFPTILADEQLVWTSRFIVRYKAFTIAQISSLRISAFVSIGFEVWKSQIQV